MQSKIKINQGGMNIGNDLVLLIARIHVMPYASFKKKTQNAATNF